MLPHLACSSYQFRHPQSQSESSSNYPIGERYTNKISKYEGQGRETVTESTIKKGLSPAAMKSKLDHTILFLVTKKNIAEIKYTVHVSMYRYHAQATNTK